MRKTIVIGVWMAIFLMLMSPMIPAMQWQNSKDKKQDITPVKTKSIKSLDEKFEQKEIINKIKNSEETEYYALIVGCTEYKDWWNSLPPNNPLPESTMKQVYYSLCNASNWKHENIYVLLNDEATKNNIVNTFDYLSTQIDEDDVFVFSWMGHGYYVEDTNGDESDGIDEAICPYDLTIDENGYQNLITDDELDVLFSSIKAKGQFIMFESCLSGGLVDNQVENNVTFVDVNQKGRVVVMSTPPGKLGYLMRDIGWPMALLYGQALSDKKCDTNHDGWISAEEAFAYVDNAYPILEKEWINTLNSQVLNKTISYAVVAQFLLALNALKKIVSRPVLRTVLSSLWAWYTYHVYQDDEYRDILMELGEMLIEMRLELKDAKNDPNMVDGFAGQLNIACLI